MNIRATVKEALLNQSEVNTGSALRVFAFFHLNLAFSSIAEECRADVIARCYWPLLKLAERIGPLGVEMSGYTLEEIAARDPAWIEAAKKLIAAGRIELIGSGYSQMIAPLVPARVTAENLRLGLEAYEKYLGVRPKLALVNEQAYASGLVPLYLDAGFEALIMDFDNPAASHPEWPAGTAFLPQLAAGPDGQKHRPYLEQHHPVPAIAAPGAWRYFAGDLCRLCSRQAWRSSACPLPLCQ